ncbi:MAG: hypothetical protein M1820_004652 [Bogoriella megaspora]|nr:MAG: hypothetical protein M1820_004652 [Bogoriella megaspora]
MEKASKVKDLVKFLASTHGDLSNITAPPFFLAPISVTEAGSCWAQRPSLFASPTFEDDPAKRSLCVLKWILAALKTQFYTGGDTESSIKKPLNAFLGEIFRGTWHDQHATSNLVAEQVSHHPPVTAVYMWDDEHGIRGEGYTRVEMSYAGSVDIRQIGHAAVHIDRFNEDYLVPIPNAKVKGFSSGKLYPELYGTYHIISSSGFISEIEFEGQGMFKGTKNHVHAVTYRRDDQKKQPIFTIDGQWTGEFTIRDAEGGIVETYDTNDGKNAPAELDLPREEDQDPWETRRAWRDVFSAINEGNIGATIDSKSKLENAQREMRAKEKSNGQEWQPLFFSRSDGDHELFDRLGSATGWQLEKEKTLGVWKVDLEKLRNLKKPYRGELTPFG